MSTDWNAEEELPPLKLSCTSSDCQNNLHCFRQTKNMKAANQFGQCRECGAELFGWEQIRRRDIKNAEHTFEILKKEKIRHDFWHIEIDQKARNHALRKGLLNLREVVIKRLRESVGKVYEMPDGKKRPYRDGYQTPYSGNSIYYAQHATASCCRTCLEYWHGILEGQDLTEDEIAYLTDLVMLYIQERLPLLADQGQKVPRIRRQIRESSSSEAQEK